MAEWEAVIGLEIHVQLKTRTKMFCSCENVWGEDPNTRTCPVCLAHPGALPVPNATAIEWTLKLGLALGCEVAERALFHRKHYWYPDLPKGYQISQYDVPLCAGGRFLLPGPDGDREIGIVRAHLEEDAAKTVHVGGAGGRIAGAAHSLVDFNRGGTPLVEVVTEPDIRSPEEARRFLQLLRQTVVELGISDAEMEKGTLRCDANVSVRELGEAGYRTKTELKNMNSFKFVADGIAAEVERQVAAYERGEGVVQRTLHYDPGGGRVSPLRSKEEADDYRYFPEPDLVPVEPAAALVERLRGEIPEPPGRRIRRLEPDVGFKLASELVSSGRDPLLAPIAANGVEARAAANFLMNDYAGDGDRRADPALIAETIKRRRDLPPDVYREAAAAASVGDEGAVTALLSQTAIADESALGPVVDAVLAENEAQVAAYRSGKQGLLGFFVGQVMQRTGGRADPRRVNGLVRERLDRAGS
ncbi:MAG: Asp-tRNA(Asn)/Glu-tRNA(Gln) amidotransferase subunit GatB [Thermoleophilia bacterium]|nr:Asp-tRNA(Asn)/Glu-tRNA(Gln) amidotransferase subunit GatB [Thermoleophilia bacterium]